MKHIIILSPNCLRYISSILLKEFKKLGWTGSIENQYYKIKENQEYFYLVYCLFSIEFKDLPKNKYIIYQLEQHTNNEFSIHYNDIKDELKDLYLNSYLSLDYCNQNINVINEKLDIKPKLLPIPFSLEENNWKFYNRNRKRYDIVFIGLLNNRRRKILNFLNKFFKIAIPSKTIYGTELIKFISRGHILLNIHYYENAILERVRLNEMINIGIPIISEKPNPLDLDSINDYKDSIKFIDIIEEDKLQNIELVKEIKNFQKIIYDKEKLEPLEEKFKNSFKEYFSLE